MSDINPYELFKFIQEGVTDEQLFEATGEAYKDVDENTETPGNLKIWECSTGALKHNYYAATAEEAKAAFTEQYHMECNEVREMYEGRLYKNLNNIDDPEEIIQSLAEKGKKNANPDIADNPAIKTDNAGVTEEPEKTKIQKEMDKQTPDVDKKSDAEVAKGKPAVKNQKAKDVQLVKVTGTTKEGRVPDNPNNVDDAEDYYGAMTEDYNDNNGEIIADGISEENVARDLASKNNGVAVQNPDTQLWSVKTRTQETSSGSSGVVPASAARESVDEMCSCGSEDCDCPDSDKKKKKKKDESVEECKDCGCGNKDCKCAPGKCDCKKVKEEVETVDEEKTTSDVAGQPEEAATSKAKHVEDASRAKGKATDNPSATAQTKGVENQVGQGIKNAQGMVGKSAARTAATDKQTADANGPTLPTTEMPKPTITKVPYVKAAEAVEETPVEETTEEVVMEEADMSSDGKAHAQQTVNKSKARSNATDNPSADANASINTTEPAASTPGGVPDVKAEKPGMKGKSSDAQMAKEGVDVSITTDDKQINVNSEEGATTITTTDNVALDVMPIEDPMVGELGMEEEPLPLDDELLFADDDQLELSDDDALEMAERLMVAEHLEATIDEKKMSAKQKKFLDDIKGKKFSKKNKEKIDDKKKEIK